MMADRWEWTGLGRSANLGRSKSEKRQIRRLIYLKLANPRLRLSPNVVTDTIYVKLENQRCSDVRIIGF